MSDATLFNHTVDLGHGYSWVYTSESEDPMTKADVLAQNPNNFIVKRVMELDAE